MSNVLPCRSHGPTVPSGCERRSVNESESRRANGPDWDRYADEYQATHGDFLGDAGFVWGPEGQTEAELGVLGPVEGLDVLEVGSGAGQCSRWVRTQGGRADRPGPLAPPAPAQPPPRRRHRRRRAVGAAPPPPHLPFADGSFDIVFCSFGALQFVADIERALDETVRVLRPGGRFAFSITHPTRWMFPDDPGVGGLTASQSYWDRTPYVEIDDASGLVSYVEHHRTLGDWVRLLAARGFPLSNLVEPEWPAEHDRVWGGWSRTRGLLTPGTAIFGARLRPG